MKSTTILVILVVLVIAVAMVSGNKAEKKAERKAARKAERRAMRKNCSYDKRNAVCDETLTPPKRVAQLIPEESSDPSCPTTKLFPCKQAKNKDMKCRYKFKEAKTAPCDEATQTKTISLKKGGEGCPLTKEIPCTKKGKRKNNGKGMKCKYNLKERKTAVCNEETQMVTINLKPGQDAGCPATKDVPCKKGRRRGNKRMNKL